MGFKYTKEWADELLHLYSLKTTTDEEEKKIDTLVMMAEKSDDIRMAQVLIECLCAGGGYGRDSTLYNTLSTMHSKVYCEALFLLVQTPKKTCGEDFSLYFGNWLGCWYGEEINQNEFETILVPLAKKYLTKKDMQNAIKDIEESNTWGDGLIDEFYAFFNKELDANWTPPTQKEIEPISEEEMQQNHEEVQKMLDKMGINVKL